MKKITDAIRGLAKFEENYRIELDKIIIVEIFNEREDFIYQLFGTSTRIQESIDYRDDEEEPVKKSL